MSEFAVSRTVVSPDVLRGRAEARTPPGQTLTAKWPVLHYGAVPKIDPESADWRLRIFGLCDRPFELSYQQVRALPAIEVHCDIHCVTHWSRLDNRFVGVSVRGMIERAGPRPDARFVMCHGEAGFTTNLPLERFMADDCILAYAWEGKELTPEHGWPLRGVVPRLYFWKSAKWIRGIELRSADAPGFWERNGYHMLGDPWQEQRFGW